MVLFPATALLFQSDPELNIFRNHILILISCPQSDLQNFRGKLFCSLDTNLF